MGLKKVLFAGLFVTLLPVLGVAKTDYRLILDAGSSGTRVHLYQVETADTTATDLQVIEIPVPDNKVKPGLSSFKDNPEQAGESLAPLIDNTLATIRAHKIPENLELSVLATAGMRLLSDAEQAAIYADVRGYLQDTPFNVIDVRTIKGEEEALFDWLAVNVLKGNFATDAKTVGALDLGGASMQIAYEGLADYPEQQQTVTVNNKQYQVVAQSYLGLGQDQFLANQVDDKAACFPKGFEAGQYNQAACLASIKRGLDQVKEQPVRPGDSQPFYAFSGYAYVRDFLTPKSPAAMKISMSGGICQQDKDTLTRVYASVPEKYLKQYCFNGHYVTSLLTYLFELADENEAVEYGTQIGSDEVNWSIGAALFYQSAH